MKRPAPVTAAIVTLSIILLLSLVSLTAVPHHHVTVAFLLAAPITPLLHGVPLAGLIRRRRWSRLSSVIVLALWAAAFFMLSVYSATKLKAPLQMIPGLTAGGLLTWLCISLLRNQDVRSYLVPSVKEAGGTEPIR